MNIKLIFLLLLPLCIFSQDQYHTNLLSNLSSSYGVEGGDFLFSDTEVAVFDATYQYGAVTFTVREVESMDFTLSKDINVTSVGNNPYDAGMSVTNQSVISEGDVILMSFWAKQSSSQSQVFVFGEESINYDKEFYLPISFTPDWTQYFIAFQSSRDFDVGGFQAGFQLASSVQHISIAGFNGVNFRDTYALTDLPSSYSSFDYDGRSLDAPWRALAEYRIEPIRKADLIINVVDADGLPVEGATVNVEMQQHDFGFGSALVTCRFPGNNCYNETYVSKVLDLDGRGHGFNECVNENALKWKSWESEWLGPPEDAVTAYRWLSDHGVTMRGHNLLWPGSEWLPPDINSNLDDLSYLRERIDSRIDEMINHPELKTYVRDWDILNEITTNRTLEYAFDDDPTLGNGRELYKQIFEEVKELDPELELYINDFVVISSGSANLVNRYKVFLDELKNANVPFDGIGFQCHIGSIPPGIPAVEQVFNEYYQRYGKRMKVTEYDINDIVDETTQADYMRDLLTLTFSHPGMDAFIMWGFWDGNHWKQNAPMFNLDWSLKPSGEVFIQKVFDDWWTNETQLSDLSGTSMMRPFKGKHLITVSKDDLSITNEINLLTDTLVNVMLPTSTSLATLDADDFIIFPNPITESSITVQFPDKYQVMDIQLYDNSWRLIKTYNQVVNHEQLQLPTAAGTYFLVLVVDGSRTTKKIIVQK